jgi:hypothetical protein
LGTCLTNKTDSFEFLSNMHPRHPQSCVLPKASPRSTTRVTLLM